MWGSFPELPPEKRIYARAYWRFLLGWQLPPPRVGLSTDAARYCRQQARIEVSQYKNKARLQGGAIVYEYPEETRGPPG